MVCRYILKNALYREYSKYRTLSVAEIVSVIRGDREMSAIQRVQIAKSLQLFGGFT